MLSVRKAVLIHEKIRIRTQTGGQCCMLSGSNHMFELQQMSADGGCDKKPVHAYEAGGHSSYLRPVRITEYDPYVLTSRSRLREQT